MKLSSIQDFLRASDIAAWLVYDFRGSNHVLAELVPGLSFLTRRLMLVIPSSGEPLAIVHNIDAPQLAKHVSNLNIYTDRTGWCDAVKQAIARRPRVAMDFSPMGELPAVSIVDAGIVDFVRSTGVEVVSSADVIQVAVAEWSDDARLRHDECMSITARTKDEAFDLVRSRLAAGATITELDVQQFIMTRLTAAGLDPDHPPIVGCNEHSGDPHFSPTESNHKPIRRGDWLLIDLWARWPGRQHIFADITWVGFAGDRVPDEHRRVFDAVIAARDAALALATERFAGGKPVLGYELDVAARTPLIDRGFEKNIRHRTGHSLSPGPKIHGLGANLDDFETRDTRQILPRTGFTIEPSLYTASFGCRSEINVYVDPTRGPVVTSPIQRDVVLI
jgi:Xaa-Pro dipeptidase